MIIFQMPDDRFYARSFEEEFSLFGPFIGGGVGRSFSWQKNLRFTNSLTSSIASFIETKAGTLTSEAFDLIQHIGQGARVMAVVLETEGAQDYAAIERARDGSFLPKLIPLMFFTLRGTTNLGFMKTVD